MLLVPCSMFLDRRYKFVTQWWNEHYFIVRVLELGGGQSQWQNVFCPEVKNKQPSLILPSFVGPNQKSD